MAEDCLVCPAIKDADVSRREEAEMELGFISGRESVSEFGVDACDILYLLYLHDCRCPRLPARARDFICLFVSDNRKGLVGETVDKFFVFDEAKLTGVEYHHSHVLACQQMFGEFCADCFKAKEVVRVAVDCGRDSPCQHLDFFFCSHSHDVIL